MRVGFSPPTIESLASGLMCFKEAGGDCWWCYAATPCTPFRN
jgi:hypothetical protein